jgi:hypothetical protein
LFSDTGAQWVRRHGPKGGITGVGKFISGFVQPIDGPTWFVTGKMREEPRVWVDVWTSPRTVGAARWLVEVRLERFGADVT